MKKGIVTFAISLIGIASFLQVNAQCEKKVFCDDYEDEYDFRSQSSYAKLSPGDTSSVNVVLYGGQKYRLFVCFDPKLGDVAWKIVNLERKTKRTIASIKRDTIINYKMEPNPDDPEGTQIIVRDKNGNDIILSKTVNADTLWNTERISYDKVIYDNKKNTDKPYLDIAPKKSERFIARIAIPAGTPNYSGCVNVYVGRMPVGSKSFSKQGKSNNSY